MRRFILLLPLLLSGCGVPVEQYNQEVRARQAAEGRAAAAEARATYAEERTRMALQETAEAEERARKAEQWARKLSNGYWWKVVLALVVVIAVLGFGLFYLIGERKSEATTARVITRILHESNSRGLPAPEPREMDDDQ